ncbi:MAG: hypothetical protein EBS00_07200, partial [Verrucomicrobia bacterium]|nr:hypothetical protein [Verrucomicrobiota bacterium]
MGRDGDRFRVSGDGCRGQGKARGSGKVQMCKSGKVKISGRDYCLAFGGGKNSLKTDMARCIP